MLFVKAQNAQNDNRRISAQSVENIARSFYSLLLLPTQGGQEISVALMDIAVWVERATSSRHYEHAPLGFFRGRRAGTLHS